MMTDWPSARFIRSARMRASVSVGPPAGNGTTIEIGRDGKVSAPARREAAGTIAAPAKSRSKRRRGRFMALPHELRCLAHARQASEPGSNEFRSARPPEALPLPLDFTERRQVPLAALKRRY